MAKSVEVVPGVKLHFGVPRGTLACGSFEAVVNNYFRGFGIDGDLHFDTQSFTVGSSSIAALTKFCEDHAAGEEAIQKAIKGHLFRATKMTFQEPVITVEWTNIKSILFRMRGKRTKA